MRVRAKVRVRLRVQIWGLESGRVKGLAWLGLVGEPWRHDRLELGYMGLKSASAFRVWVGLGSSFWVWGWVRIWVTEGEHRT